jgi:hypothetical protein
MLWFAGAGCLFVSYAHGAMPGSNAANEAACPAHQPAENVSHHQATNAGEPVPDTSSDTIVVDSGHSCCKIQAVAASPKLHSASTNELASSIAVARQTRLTSLPPPAGAMNCCPLMSTAVAAVSKPRADEATTTPVEPVALPAFLNQKETASLTTPLRLPNRGHTYLHCCAFLI